MNDKTKGGAQAPRKSYDYTSTQRQQKRRDKLNVIAKSHGFPGWSAFETALLNGQISVMLNVKRDPMGEFGPPTPPPTAGASANGPTTPSSSE